MGQFSRDNQAKLSRPRRRRLWAGLIASAVLLAAGAGTWLWTERNEVVASTVVKLSMQTIAPLPELEVGDILLRMGVGADSYVIAAASDSLYSHAGIVSAVTPEILVTHATTADDAGSKFEGVITIPIANFVSEASRIAVVRYPGLDEAEKPLVTSYLKSMEGQPFSLNQDSDSIYCSNLVLYALQDHVQIKVEPQKVDMPLFDGTFYFPQAFLEDSQAQLIYVYPDVQPATVPSPATAHGSGPDTVTASTGDSAPASATAQDPDQGQGPVLNSTQGSLPASGSVPDSTKAGQSSSSEQSDKP